PSPLRAALPLSPRGPAGRGPCRTRRAGARAPHSTFPYSCEKSSEKFIVDARCPNCFPWAMNELPVEGLDEKTVIVCVSSSHRDRARVARLMNGCGTLLIFPDMEAARRMLCGARDPRTDRARPATAPARPGAVVRGALVVDLDRQ